MAKSLTTDDINAAVDAWFNENIQGSLIGFHTECYNYVFQAREDLKDRLCMLITGDARSRPLVLDNPAEEAAAEPAADAAE